MIRRGATTLLIAGALAACASGYDSTAAIPSTLVIRGGDMQSGTVGTRLAAPVLVQVKDQNGQPASAISVQFAASGASPGHATVLTDATGDAATVVTLGSVAGPVTVTASVTGVALPVVFSLTATAGPAAAIVALQGSGQSGTVGTLLDSALVVRVNDEQGNAVAGAIVDWASATGVFTTAVQTTSGADGMSSARLQLPSAPGPVVAKATLHGTTTSATFFLTAVAM